jgi:hypothetical protein
MATEIAPPPVAPTMLKPRSKFWRKIATRQFLIYSILFHVALGGGFMLWKIHDEANTRKKFMSPGAGADAARQGAEHKVSLGRKQSTMSAPEQAKRVTTNSAFAKVALPEMPDMPTATTDVFANRAIGMGGAGSAFGATGTPGGGGNGNGSGINFFGLRTRARSIVFLVDVSDSMVLSSALPPATTGGSQASSLPAKPLKGTHTYSALEREVARTIRGLDNTMSFSVICFAGDVEAYHPLLMKVTDTEKERAIQWIGRHSPALNLVAEQKAADRAKAGFKDNPNAPKTVTNFNHAGTRASAALDMAFAMNPDAICFVSDGIPSDGVAKDILTKIAAKQKELPRPAQIHVVAYLADSGQAFMKALADQNQGSFKEIKPGMASFGF